MISQNIEDIYNIIVEALKMLDKKDSYEGIKIEKNSKSAIMLLYFNELFALMLKCKINGEFDLLLIKKNLEKLYIKKLKEGKPTFFLNLKDLLEKEINFKYFIGSLSESN